MTELFLTFLKLGLTSFGGPVAHLGFFYNEFVIKKNWLSEHDYADLVALGQFLPGPASSQVGMAIGFQRQGIVGAVVAWLAFTLPSAMLLIFFAVYFESLTHRFGQSWLHGLKIAAFVVVCQAVWQMSKRFCADYKKAGIAVVSFAMIFSTASAAMQIGVIVLGGVLGFLLLTNTKDLPRTSTGISLNHKLSIGCLIAFSILLFLLPFIAKNTDVLNIKLVESFYHVGALVFGGGHVVLPLLQKSVVDQGWISSEIFMVGYGAAQAVPGPLFSLAAFLGFAANRWSGALVSTVMIFLPSFLLVVGVLPYWGRLSSENSMRSAVAGVNAAVVGLLIAALYNPIWIAAIFDWKDFSIALVALYLLMAKKWPTYAIVIALALFTSMPDIWRSIL